MIDENKLTIATQLVHFAWAGFVYASGGTPRFLPSKEDMRSTQEGLKSFLENGHADPKIEHERWVRDKVAQGWQYNEVRDDEKKFHPLLVPFDALPTKEQLKDSQQLEAMRAALVLVGLLPASMDEVWH